MIHLGLFRNTPSTYIGFYIVLHILEHKPGCPGNEKYAKYEMFQRGYILPQKEGIFFPRIFEYEMIHRGCVVVVGGGVGSKYSQD